MNKIIIMFFALLTHWPAISHACWPCKHKATRKNEAQKKRVRFADQEITESPTPSFDEDLLRNYLLNVFIFNTEILGIVVVDSQAALTIVHSLERVKKTNPQALPIFYESITKGKSLTHPIKNLLYQEKLITENGDPLNSEIIALVRHYVSEHNNHAMTITSLWIHDLQEYQDKQKSAFAVYQATRYAIQQSLKHSTVFFATV